jgi:hypothetical protein
MAIKYLNNITLEQNELQNAVIHPLGTAPSGTEGQVYYNTGTNRLMAHNGSAWYSVNGDVESISSTTTGQITVTGGTGATPSVAAVTGAVVDGGTALATGDQIHDFVTGLGYISDAGVTAFTSGTGLSTNTAATGSVSVTNTDRGSSQNIFKNFAVAGQSTVVADSNNDTVTLVNGSNVTITTNAGTDAITIAAANDNTTYQFNTTAGAANTAVLNLDASAGTDTSVTFSGTTNEIEVTESTGANGTITVGLPSNVTIGNNLTVTGNLTVSGTTTTVNTETINLADNIITLNSNETGAPSQDGGIEIERGTSTNTSLLWDEGTDRWTFTNDGSTYNNIPVPSEYGVVTGGTSTDYSSSGASVLSSIVLTNGVVQSTSNRTLTLANLGYTGATNANNYVHPTGDGNLHVIATGTTNNGKVLTAGATAGSLTWTDKTVNTDTVYVHPTHAGDDINIDTGALTGATVISDLDLNVTTDTLGHVTDANATISTRTLTAADIGAQAAGTYNTVIGTDSDYTQSGVNILKSMTLTDGVITAFTSGNMQSASTTVSGVVELATVTEATTGTDTSRAVTPAGLSAAIASVDGLGTGNHKTVLIGNGSLTTCTATHSFALTDFNKVMVQLVEVSTGATVFAEVNNRATNSVDIVFSTAPTTNQYMVLMTKMEY